jgi:hypothetical protein
MGPTDAGKEHELRFLDPVLHLTARTIHVFVLGAGIDVGDRAGDDD